MNESEKRSFSQVARFCRKCLMSEYIEDPDKFVKNYIDGIPDINRTEAAEYERRLGICEECESLLNGMCRKCGCFVAVRAAVAKNYCPAPREKW